MSVNKSWSELVRLTCEYPNAMSPPEMHGYLVARLIDMKGLESTPWLQDILGVREADEISEPAGEVASRFLEELLQSFGDMETAGKLPDFGAGGGRHWARDWARGFNRAVALRQEAWDEHRNTGIVVARILYLMRMLDDPELHSEASGRPPGEHEAFVERQVARIPSFLRLLYNDVLINPRLKLEAFEENESEDADEPIELPVFSDEELRDASNDELVYLLSTLDDRVPENIIRECARRGEDIVPSLWEVIETYTDPERFDEDLWWSVLHCIHVLGLIPGANAGRVLLGALRFRDEDPDDYLWEWLSGSWPALFENKLDHVRAELREIAANRTHDWMTRADVMECLGADPEGREANLDQIAGLAADETEEVELRELAGGILLDYPRERHRELLLRLAEEQRQRDTFGAPFDESEVLFAYGNPDHRKDDHFRNPWRFYDPENILKRQHRWRREDRERVEQEMLMDQTRLAPVETIVREGPKVGRNDPCPCGSGRKYKKCCFNN